MLSNNCPLMRKRIAIIFILLFSFISGACFAQKFTFSGTITDKTTGEPVEFATVVLEGPELWAVADVNGRFSISGVPAVKTTVSVSCLGYVEWKKEIQIGRDIKDFKVTLTQDNLSPRRMPIPPPPPALSIRRHWTMFR